VGIFGFHMEKKVWAEGFKERRWVFVFTVGGGEDDM